MISSLIFNFQLSILSYGGLHYRSAFVTSTMHGAFPKTIHDWRQLFYDVINMKRFFIKFITAFFAEPYKAIIF